MFAFARSRFSDTAEQEEEEEEEEDESDANIVKGSRKPKKEKVLVQ